MNKTIKIKSFVIDRIAQIDSEYAAENDVMKKLHLSAMRTTFASILNTYMSDEGELGLSYLKHSHTYINAACYEQASFYASLAKKHLKNSELLQEAVLLSLTCLLKLEKIQEANDLLKDFTPHEKQLEFYEIQTEIYEKMGNEQKTFEVASKIEALIEKKYTSKSIEMGLHLIEKGKKKGSFRYFNEALILMQEGMNLLIEARYRDQLNIGNIYTQMAAFNRELNNLQSEYSSLICAHSMIRQLPNMQKQLLSLMHSIATNLFQRQDYENALKEYLKIEALKKRIYGESSLIVGKTIKNISDTLSKMNKKAQSKKYDQQYSRIISCHDRKGMTRQKPLKYIPIKNQN